MTGATEDPVVDDAAIDRLTRIGGADFVVEMIDLFLENAPGRLQAARKALASGDHGALYQAAHSLKSTSANVGARRLQTLAAQLEEQARSEQAAGLDGLLAALEEAFPPVRDRLRALRLQRGGAA